MDLSTIPKTIQRRINVVRQTASSKRQVERFISSGVSRRMGDRSRREAFVVSQGVRSCQRKDKLFVREVRKAFLNEPDCCCGLELNVVP